MCGIVGYVGKDSAEDFVMKGLKALEYRGYDSAGIVTINGEKLKYIKDVGQVINLQNHLKKIAPFSKDKSDLSCGIGHTRWATHGGVTDLNAHPHTNTDETIFVVCNGIIENYQELKAQLVKDGYKFISETDTEVVPHLIDHYLKKNKGNFLLAFKAAIEELRGAYAIAAVYSLEPGAFYIARLSSPLVVGVGQGEHFIASDPNALIEKTKKVIFLNDYEIGKITSEKALIESLDPKNTAGGQVTELDYEAEKSDMGKFPHYMLKEIHEIPATIKSATRGRVKPEINTIKLGGLESVKEQLAFIDRIVIVACGTAYYAGLIGEYLIEEIAGIPVEVQMASEFKYRHEPFSRGTALLVISQSGETADTIAAIKKVENYGVLKLGIVNAVGSTISRITDAGVYCHAGPEQSVASTKAFIAQIIILTEIALHIAGPKSDLYKPLLKELSELADKASDVLEQSSEIKKMAKKYSKYRDFLFIGRGYQFPSALEGAIKLKEISYIHAEGFSAGEMKHGPIAMIDKNFPTFALAPDDSLLEKTMSNMEEIKARKGPLIAIATKGNKNIARLADDVIYIPQTLEQLQPVLTVIVMQLFAYYVAVEKNLNVDRPRNLAKSVTVE